MYLTTSICQSSKCRVVLLHHKFCVDAGYEPATDLSRAESPRVGRAPLIGQARKLFRSTARSSTRRCHCNPFPKIRQRANSPMQSVTGVLDFVAVNPPFAPNRGNFKPHWLETRPRNSSFHPNTRLGDARFADCAPSDSRISPKKSTTGISNSTTGISNHFPSANRIARQSYRIARQSYHPNAFLKVKKRQAYPPDATNWLAAKSRLPLVAPCQGLREMLGAIIPRAALRFFALG